MCQFIQKLQIPQRPNTSMGFSLGVHQFLTSVLRTGELTVIREHAKGSGSEVNLSLYMCFCIKSKELEDLCSSKSNGFLPTFFLFIGEFNFFNYEFFEIFWLYPVFVADHRVSLNSGEQGRLLIVVKRLSCPVARGIFLHQESNLCSLHWQADACPLGPQGCPHPFN